MSYTQKIEPEVVALIIDRLTSSYNADEPYSLDDMVSYTGIWYRSLSADNEGNTPNISPLLWDAVQFNGDDAAVNAQEREYAEQETFPRVAVYTTSSKDAFGFGEKNSGVYEIELITQAQTYALDDKTGANAGVMAEGIRHALLRSDMIASFGEFAPILTIYSWHLNQCFVEPIRDGLHRYTFTWTMRASPVVGS